MLAEYDKKFGVWKQMRRVMILKCAESIALRAAFPQQLNGLYTQEDMPPNFGPEGAVPSAIIEPAKIEPTTPATHKIQTRCKFQGHEIEKIYEADPNWIDDVLSDEAKKTRMMAIDLVALQAFTEIIKQPVVEIKQEGEKESGK